jgi:maltose O-acetyltransferase
MTKLFALIYGVSAFLSTLTNRVLSRIKLRALFPHSRSCRIDWTCEIKYAENIQLGERVIVGPYCTLGGLSKITIGDDVRLSKNVMLETAGLSFRDGLPYKHIGRPIVLERGVWVGAGAVILGGVRIGERSIIGAGAVITRDIDAESIVVGAPNRTIPFNSK